MQKVMLVLAIFFLVANVSGKPPVKSLWQSWIDVTTLAEQTGKPIFIDIYTDWCRYCKIMDATTYKNDSVIAFLQQHYLRYKFNAEGKDTLRWNGKNFTFNPRYDVHELAVHLTRGNVVYPTTVIIVPGGQPFYKHGEIKVGEMEILLKFFSNKNYESQSLAEFTKSFEPRWK